MKQRYGEQGVINEEHPKGRGRQGNFGAWNAGDEFDDLPETGDGEGTDNGPEMGRPGPAEGEGDFRQSEEKADDRDGQKDHAGEGGVGVELAIVIGDERNHHEPGDAHRADGGDEESDDPAAGVGGGVARRRAKGDGVGAAPGRPEPVESGLGEKNHAEDGGEADLESAVGQIVRMDQQNRGDGDAEQLNGIGPTAREHGDAEGAEHDDGSPAGPGGGGDQGVKNDGGHGGDQAGFRGCGRAARGRGRIRRRWRCAGR